MNYKIKKRIKRKKKKKNKDRILNNSKQERLE